jgi:hypothetical protein
MILGLNSSLFFKQCQLLDLCNGEVGCSLWCTDWILKYYLDELRLQRVKLWVYPNCRMPGHPTSIQVTPQNRILEKVTIWSDNQEIPCLYLTQRFITFNMTDFWDVAPCSLVETDRRFKGAYCLHHQGNPLAWWWGQYAALKRQSTSKETTRLNIPEGCHLHTHHCENPKSQ